MNFISIVLLAFSCIFLVVSGSTIKVEGRIYCCRGEAKSYKLKPTHEENTNQNRSGWNKDSEDIGSKKEYFDIAQGFNNSTEYCMPIDGAEISLWDEDSTIPGDNDDLLNTTFALSNGSFSIEGQHSEIGNEEYYVLARTECGKAKWGVKNSEKCRRVSKISIDPEFIDRTYNFGDYGPYRAWVLEEELGENDLVLDDKSEKCQ